MAIPEQVRRQSEAVAKLYEDLNPESEAAQEAAEMGNEGSEAEPANRVVPLAAGSASAEQGRSDNTDEELTYEQRWRSLQGMYNADTTRLRAENNQMNQRVSQLEQLISSLSAPQQGQPAQGTAARLITDKDTEEYGDSIDVMRRAAREELSEAYREIADLKRTVMQVQTNVVPKVESVVQRQALTAENTFWSELSAIVPDWREINANQGFHSWLLEVDPLSGMNRQVYLDAAQGQLDAHRVGEFFRTWQSSNGNSAAQQTRTATATQLEKQIAPGRGRTTASASTAGNDAKAYSRVDIAKFFDDVRKGVYKGKEQERDRIERDIFAAQREGRIT
jgi:hypothetical protein